MFRAGKVLFLASPQQKRIGIFPLHLDPPTVQHREIFRQLVCDVEERPVDLRRLASSGSHEDLAEYYGFGALRQQSAASGHPSAIEGQRHSNRLQSPNIAVPNMSSSSSSSPPDLNFTRTLAEDIAAFARSVSRLRFGDFEELILVPNTRYPVTLRQSSHLAAMAYLATRDIPRVSLDFTALEHHDETMPVVSDLVQKYGSRATLLHWLPDAHEMQTWKDFADMEEHVPFVLLCPTGFVPHSIDLKGLLESARAPPPPPLATATSTTTTSEPIRSTSTSALAKKLKRASGGSGSGMNASNSAASGATIGNRLAPKSCEVLEVRRWSGADVRQKLWERSLDPHLLVPGPVLRYMDSCGLYRDFRKGFFTPMSAPLTCHKAVAHHNPTADATVAFSGLIPRLELHYDQNNLLAREQYAKLKQFECVDGQEPDLIVPIGGDGYMMHCIRRNWRRFIPFYGVNAGHVGYLLNDAGTIEELFSAPLKLHHMSMLYCEAEAESATGEKKKIVELAFNDAWVERASGQTALIRVLVNGTERLRRVRGDGVLVSTAAGSTAYSQALGASPVPVGVPLIQLVGSNVVSPAQWKPVHLNQEDVIELECVDNYKRPCKGYVDSVDVGIVSRMTIRTSRVAGVQIAFSHSGDLQQKLYSLQFPKGG